jgi:hypothetical protein
MRLNETQEACDRPGPGLYNVRVDSECSFGVGCVR